MVGKLYPKAFLGEVLTEIRKRQDQKLPLFAAFDADGTLWNTDLGENFFQYQIKNKLVSLPLDPWIHYKEMKKINPIEAYAWLAQICQGHSIQEVRVWAEQALAGLAHVPVFACQKELIQLLLAEGVQVFIITASITWSVEPGAALFGIERKNVLGFETEVQNNTVTDKTIAQFTYKKGKADTLLLKTGGVRPFLCSGNSTGDTQLLEASDKFAIAMMAADAKSDLGKTEIELAAIAKQKGWTIFQPLAQDL